MARLPSYGRCTHYDSSWDLEEEDFDVDVFQGMHDSEGYDHCNRESGDDNSDVDGDDSTVQEGNASPAEPPKKKRKRRCAGDLSGRQMAAKLFAKERKRGQFHTESVISPFPEAVQEARTLFMKFCNGEEGTEDHASAMRLYFYQRYGISTTVSLTDKIYLH